MESTGRKFGSSREDMIIGRFSFVLVTAMFVALTVIEVAVALNMEFTRTLVHKAMWVGTALWALLAVRGGVDLFRNKSSENKTPLYCTLLFTTIAIGSVTGIYVPMFTTFAIWSNAVLAVLFFAVMVWVVPQGWRDCKVTPLPAES